MEEDKKISLPEKIFLSLLTITADLFDIITVVSLFVPVLGEVMEVINWFVDIYALVIVQTWLIMKGGIGVRKQVVALLGNILEFVPVLEVLPLRTIALWISIYLINHPEVLEKAMMFNIRRKAAKKAVKEAGDAAV